MDTLESGLKNGDPVLGTQKWGHWCKDTRVGTLEWGHWSGDSGMALRSRHAGVRTQQC